MPARMTRPEVLLPLTALGLTASACSTIGGQADDNDAAASGEVVLVTHETNEAAMRAALAQIGRSDAVLEPPALIRIEPA